MKKNKMNKDLKLFIMEKRLQKIFDLCNGDFQSWIYFEYMRTAWSTLIETWNNRFDEVPELFWRYFSFENQQGNSVHSLATTNGWIYQAMKEDMDEVEQIIRFALCFHPFTPEKIIQSFDVLNDPDLAWAIIQNDHPSEKQLLDIVETADEQFDDPEDIYQQVKSNPNCTEKVRARINEILEG